MSVTIRDIAKASGVSIGTVSRVLHNRTNVAPGTSRRVREAIDRLGYDPISNIPLARLHAARRIGLVLPDSGIGVADSFYSRAVFSLQQSVEEHGCDMTVFSERDAAARLEGSAGPGVNGLIYFCPTHTQDPFYAKIRDRGISCTVIRRTGRTRGIIRISDSDYDGGRKVAEHLFALGHRRVLLLQNGDGVVQQRMQGLRDFYREQNVPVRDEAGIRDGWQAGLPALPETWVGRFVRNEGRPTAVFTYHDRIAMSVINQLRECGLSVPADVSVTGYDDTDTARLFYPSLTSVRIPVEAMVQTAANLLAGGGPKKGMSQAVMEFENELIIRQSTAACTAS